MDSDTDVKNINNKLADFFENLKIANKSVLMLDYDGTLAPFKKDRNRAFPYKGVRDILKKLILTERTRIVIISGRWTEDLIPLLSLKQLPEIWGSHGIERLKPDGDYTIMEMPEKGLQGLAEADVWIEKNDFGNYCEEKPGCIALHWRGLSCREIKDIQTKALADWTIIARQKKLLLNKFDGGIELRVPGITKGVAVKTILREAGQGTLAAYLGDDLTDEDAFKALKKQGLGILVRKKYRDTHAQVWLKPPQDLLKFLKNWYHIVSSK